MGHTHITSTVSLNQTKKTPIPYHLFLIGFNRFISILSNQPPRTKSNTFIMQFSFLVFITLATLLSNSLAFQHEGYGEPKPEHRLGPNEELPHDGHYLRERSVEHPHHHHHHDKARVIARDEDHHRPGFEHHDRPQHHHDRREADHHHDHKFEHDRHHARDEQHIGDPHQAFDHHDHPEHEGERHQPRGIKKAVEEKIKPKSKTEKNTPVKTPEKAHVARDLKHVEEQKPQPEKVESPHHPVVETKHIPVIENKHEKTKVKTSNKP